MFKWFLFEGRKKGNPAHEHSKAWTTSSGGGCLPCCTRQDYVMTVGQPIQYKPGLAPNFAEDRILAFLVFSPIALHICYPCQISWRRPRCPRRLESMVSMRCFMQCKFSSHGPSGQSDRARLTELSTVQELDDSQQCHDLVQQLCAWRGQIP